MTSCIRSKKQKERKEKKRKREKEAFSHVVINQGLERNETERQRDRKERKEGKKKGETGLNNAHSTREWHMQNQAEVVDMRQQTSNGLGHAEQPYLLYFNDFDSDAIHRGSKK